MNDPEVVALSYRVEYEKTKHIDKVQPLRDCRRPEFDLTVEDKIARFKFKKFYASEDKAREAVEPFIQQWEFEAEMEGEPGCLKLSYDRAEIVDRNPLPPECIPAPLQASATAVFEVDFSVSAPATVWTPQYPPTPTGDPVDLDDPYVDRMRRRYKQYRQGQAKLPEVAYVCVDLLEEKYGGRKEAARKCGVSKKVLGKIATLASEKGGADARKAAGADDEFTDQEKRFLNQAVMEIILRAAQVAADDSQRLPQITLADLPSL